MSVLTAKKLFVVFGVLLAFAAAAAEKLVPIFDGKTLDGWEQLNGTAKYTVEDGMIVGTTAKGSPNSFLCTKKQYGDFILEFEVKNDPQLNTGVQLRAHTYKTAHTVWTVNRGRRQVTHKAGRVYGYQVEISNAETGTSGGIYDEARRGWIDNISDNAAASKAYKDNQWNKYRVVAIGDSIKTWVNGVPCADLVDSVDLTGFLGLQVHAFRGDRPEQVRWRNIRIEDLGRHVWRPLWDGKTLKGWKPMGGGKWTVEDGVLHGTNPAAEKQGGLLVSDQKYGDFTARLKFKALKGNSGFFFRIEPRAGQRPAVVGFQAEIDATKDIGGLYETGGRKWVVQPTPEQVSLYYKPDDWNDMSVSAHGRRIVIHVNGIKTVDVKNDSGRLNGNLALQVHGGRDVDVMFKDIEILRPEKH